MSRVTEEYLEKDFYDNDGENISSTQAMISKKACDVSIPLPKLAHTLIVGTIIAMASGVIILDIYECIWWILNK